MQSIQLLLPALFLVSGLACIGLTFQTNSITEESVRSGLRYTLIFSALWSFTELSKFIITEIQISTAIHIIGLFFGLVTVFSWFQFASAFSGRDYHEKPIIRKASITTLVSILAIKITNPIHKMYFDLTIVEEPVNHVSVETLFLNDVVTVLAYSTSIFGVYLVYIGLKRRDQSLINIISLISFLAVPSIITLSIRTELILPAFSGIFLDPLGVAVFAFATLLTMNSVYADLYKESKEDFINSIDSPVIIADNEGIIADCNSQFTSLSDDMLDTGDCFSDITDEFEEFGDIKDNSIITIGDRYYSINLVSYSNETSEDSIAVIMRDKTSEIETEQTVERQEEQFEYLAEGMSHEIRNIIQIIRGHSDVLLTEDLSDSQNRSVEAISNVSEQLNRVSEDLNVLAMTGEASFTTNDYELSRLLSDPISESSISVSVEDDRILNVHERRFELMSKKLIQFVEETNGSKLKFEFDGDSLVVTGDCDSLSGVSIDKAFSYGEAVPSADVGSILPAVKAVVDSHGWVATVDQEFDGFKIRIDGIESENVSDN